MNKLAAVILASALVPAVAHAGGADITGKWIGWSCLVGDTACPPQQSGEDNISTLVFGTSPKTTLGTATWHYPNLDFPFTPADPHDCNSHLQYVSDFGGGTGAYHYWTFRDIPLGDCMPGTVVIAIEDGVPGAAMQVWWYGDNGNTQSNTDGFLKKSKLQ